MVDEQEVGRTPCEVKVELGGKAEREVEVVLAKDGYQSRAARVTLRRGEPAPWKNVRLERLPTESLRPEQPRPPTGQPATTPTWEDTEPLADKFVPILSVGTGTRIGVARVSGPKAAVDTVQAVAQIEGDYKRIARGRAFVPVATENVIRTIERVHNVSVTGYVDLRF
jgi:hypothetical protein